MFKGRELSDSKFQLDALDGLRGLAALMVFLSHTSNEGIYFSNNLDFSGIGKSGVFLFFVLSSFLLTYPFINKGMTAFNKDFLASYFVRRFFRIYPLYSVYLLTGLLTTSFLGMLLKSNSTIGIPFHLSLKEFIKHLVLLQGKSVTWSILVEFRFYFVLPVLALLYTVVLKNKLLPVIATTIAIITVSQLIWPQSESAVNETNLGYYLPIFFMGSLLSVSYHHWRSNGLSNNKSLCIFTEIAGLISAIALILMTPSISSWLTYQPISRDFYHKQFLLYGLLWSVVIFASITGIGILRRLFEISLLRYLGFISFSMYLLHIVPLFFMENFNISVPKDTPMLAWLLLSVTVLISHISWTLIEKPTSKIRYSPISKFRLSFSRPEKT